MLKALEWKKVNKQREACNQIIWFTRDFSSSVWSSLHGSLSWTPAWPGKRTFFTTQGACLHTYGDALKSRPRRGKLRRSQHFPLWSTNSLSSEFHSSVYKTTPTEGTVPLPWDTYENLPVLSLPHCIMMDITEGSLLHIWAIWRHKRSWNFRHRIWVNNTIKETGIEEK